jgi:cell volume regulation protein A
MFAIDSLILVAGPLILLSIVSSKLSARFGVPVLVLFMALGMLAGSEGIGGIEFENYALSQGIGTLALAVILFDGGLSTTTASIRVGWKPSLVLATAGVLITSVVTGLAAARILNLSRLEGLLLGSIVASTDAAAVFTILRTGGIRLPARLAATLEIESGSNDPMAIFLTIGLIEILSGRMALGPSLLGLFATQMVVGTLAGLAVGFAAVWLVNRINLDTAGLYPVLVGACGMLAFGLAAELRGSGFLAIYLAGIVLGNSRLVFRRGVLLFHDAAAWLAQIMMFVVLGLLSFPSRLFHVAGRGLLVAAILILVARPLAVVLTLLPFRFPRRELAFLSWVGLKGAVPITLATFPFMFGLPRAALLFDVVFFVVIVSELIQGWTILLVARRLGVQLLVEPTPPLTLEISSLRHVKGDIVDYTIGPDSRAAGRLVRELGLPAGAVAAIVTREQTIIPPHGNTRILAGDHVILVLRPGLRPLVDQIFGRTDEGRDVLPAPESAQEDRQSDALPGRVD